ncbi:MAG: alpha/beta hydrolase [Nevskia sp.]|nr:alpha/beta hydrolase [Nevskia sp.]
MNMKHTEGTLFGVNNLSIFRQSWVPLNPRAVVVIAHGLGEHSGRYAHVVEHLCALGCAVYALDHRGHGRSAGPRAYVDRFAHAVSDLDQLVDLARREQRTSSLKRPLFLLGHSMGGALALSYTLKFQGKLDGLILSGAAVALDGAPPLMKPLAKLLSVLAPKLGMFHVQAELISRDPAVVAGYNSDPLNCHGKVPARTLGEIVNLVEWLPAALSVLKLPMLVMHGGADKLAGVAGSERVFARAGSADKTLKIYDDLYHEIFNELPPDRARVLLDLGGWIEARFVLQGAVSGRLKSA